MPLSPQERTTFLDWCLAHPGTSIHPAIEFKSSEIEGTGVFLNPTKLSSEDTQSTEDPVIVLRVPKTLSLSIDTIAESLLTRQLQHEVEIESQSASFVKQGHILISFLSKLRTSFEEQIDPYVRGGLNETNILVGEIQTLMILKEIRNRYPDQYGGETMTGPFAEMDPYFDLLLQIDVNAVKTDQQLYEPYKQLFKFNEREFRYEIESLRNEAVLEAIKETFPHLSITEDIITTNWLRSVEMAVISRILEIPEPLSDSEKEGFAVSSTLVPIIDFVNHSNDLVNCYFDADKDNGDIVLKLDLTKIQGAVSRVDHELELFIQYSDYEDTFRFLHSYAFIPKSHTIRPLYELTIDREYLSKQVVHQECNYNLGLMLRWFQILPNVQFVITYDSANSSMAKVQINLDNNFIVFGFSKGLSYDSEIAVDIVGSTLSEFGSFSDEFVEKYLQLEESLDNDAIVDYPATPFVNSQGEAFENIEDLVKSTEDEEIESLMGQFVEFLNKYATYRLGQLHRFLTQYEQSSTNSSSVIQFVKFEMELLETFQKEVSKAENPQDLIIDSEECDPEWLKLRLTPRTVNNKVRQQMFEEAAADADVTTESADVTGIEESLDDLTVD
ncbi:hypothetical protein WICPIJ_002139 [Wickerhamomyces pijperi]|uniref:SET domain-containing protein n=1 Tax=Wickerhamomyces pijperi TaxID=599730 RepID=A0A9P8QCA6_WICPI|nr:hypothetical protein WICPIJ_002139 [Wickerhamomyces pijperi]